MKPVNFSQNISSLPLNIGESLTIYLHNAMPGLIGERMERIEIGVNESGDFYAYKSPGLRVKNELTAPADDPIRMFTTVELYKYLQKQRQALPLGLVYIVDLGLVKDEDGQWRPRYQVDIAGVSAMGWFADEQKAREYAEYLRNARQERE